MKKVVSGTRKFSDISDAERTLIEGWFPNFIVGKFKRLYFDGSKVMLDYTVGSGPHTLNVGDSPYHLLLLLEMGFNLIAPGEGSQ